MIKDCLTWNIEYLSKKWRLVGEGGFNELKSVCILADFYRNWYLRYVSKTLKQFVQVVHYESEGKPLSMFKNFLPLFWLVLAYEQRTYFVK